MKINTTENYISFDNKTFNSKELCELYETNFLTDKQLQDCFHFFHKKYENIGDLDNAKKPSDASHYKFNIERNENEQIIKLYEYFRTYPSGELCNSYMRLGLVIKHNQDFIVLYNAIEGWDDRHYEGRCTYKIKEFYKFLDNLRTVVD